MTSIRKKIRPAKGMTGRPEPAVILRLLAKVRVEERDHPTPCWIWTGYRDPWGYPQIKYAGRAAWAHRVAFLAFNGQLPAGLEVDHLCHNPSCINPDHLAVRGVSANRADQRRTKSDIPF
jgi:hypothetical protein